MADSLNDISEFVFGSLSINRTEARFSGGTTREQLLVFLKDVRYNGQVYLSDSVSSTLRTNIINKLNTVMDFTYTDVVIRTMRGVDTEIIQDTGGTSLSGDDIWHNTGGTSITGDDVIINVGDGGI